jgi:hypothetical protein
MKVCYCEGCHKKFYGNSTIEAHYSESNYMITQDRHSTYEVCNECAIDFKQLMDSIRLENLKTNFADEFKKTIIEKEKGYTLNNYPVKKKGCATK